MLQTAWSSMLNPVLGNPITSGRLVEDVALVNGTTVVNHKLGRALQGWIIVNINGIANIYSPASNNLTLTLVSDAVVNVSLYVF